MESHTGKNSVLGKIGKYELIRELGRGGMGVVYAARDESLGRIVALKTLLRTSGENADTIELERFQREARLAASLRHPNIIAVHDVGVHEQIHYFTMDYIEGMPIHEYVKKYKTEIAKMVGMIRDVADALSLAHSKNIVHRDIKPGNILVDTQGVPHLGDFGLARNVNTDKSLTISGIPIGTPGYMSPEQASGRNSHVGRASDVYSLGAVLYELLTGRPPCLGTTLNDTIEAILRSEPIAPRKLVAGLSSDLETICLKCLEKDQQRRYPNARGLTMDLGRYLQGETIHARPATVAYRTGKWIGRNKILSALVSLCLVVVVAIVYLFLLAPGLVTLTTKASIAGTLQPVYPAIIVNGRKIAGKGLHKLPLRPGYHRIGLNLDGYEPQEFFVNTTPGQEVKLEKQLVRQKGKITVHSFPSQVEAVFTNQTTLETYRLIVPIYDHALETGNYEVVFSKENHFPQKQKMTIRPDKPVIVSVQLQPMLIWTWEISEDATIGSIKLADTNNDGELELVSFGDTGSITAYEFQKRRKLWSILNRYPPSTYKTVLRDINKDGFLDFIVAQHSCFMAIDGKTHQEIFSAPLFWGNTFGLFDANGDGLEDFILMSQYRPIECYEQNGKKLWSCELAIGNHAWPVFLDDRSMVQASGGELYLIEPATGRYQSLYRYGGSNSGIGDIADIKLAQLAGIGRVLLWFSRQQGLLCMELATRRMLWRWNHCPVMIDTMTLADVNSDGQAELFVQVDQLFCLDLRTGKEIWHLDTQNRVENFSPCVSDLNRDGVAEVIVYSQQGMIYVVNGLTGALINQYVCQGKVQAIIPYDTEGDGKEEILFLSDDAVHCIRHRPETQVRISDADHKLSCLPPGLADLDGDGWQELVLSNSVGEVYCLQGKTWEVLWRYRTDIPVNNIPVLADLTGDAIPELILHADRHVWAQTLDGKKMWQFQTEDGQSGKSPIVFDANRDGKPEVLVTSGYIGNLYLLEGNSGRLLWHNQIQRLYIMPGVADLTGSGERSVIVTASIFYTNEKCGMVSCFRARDGQLQWNSRIPSFSEGGTELAIQDSDGDSIGEVYAAQVGGYLSRLDGKTGQAKWHYRVRGGDVRCYPAVSDCDGDGQAEVLITTSNNDIHCLNAATGAVKWSRYFADQMLTVFDIDMAGSTVQLMGLSKDVNQDGLNDWITSNFRYSWYIFSGKDGQWLGHSRQFGTISCPLRLQDINGDHKADFFFVDRKSRLVCIYDFPGYCQKLSAIPQFSSCKYQDAALLWLAYCNQLLQHRAYIRLDEIVTTNPGCLQGQEARLYFYQAICALVNNRQDAGQLFQKSLALSPRFTQCQFLQLVAYLNDGQEESAGNLAKALIQESLPEFHAAYLHYRHLLRPPAAQKLQKLLPPFLEKLQGSDKALQTEYLQFISKQAEDQYRWELGLKYGLFGDALYQQKRALYIHRVLELLNKVSSVYARHQGLDILDHALEIVPDSPELLTQRGLLYLMTNISYAQGLADIQQSLALQPNQPALLLFKGRTFYDAQKYQESLADFTNCLRLAPKESYGYLARAIACIALQEYPQALQTLERLGKQNLLPPNHPHVALATVLRLIAQGNPDQAKRLFTQAVGQLQGRISEEMAWLWQKSAELLQK